MALIGTELLARVKELGDVSKSELVREAGYVSTMKDGSEGLTSRLSMRRCWKPKALILEETARVKGRAGRSLSYVTKVLFNGNILLGKAHTAPLDLKPGDEFEIKLGKKQIRLIPSGTAEEG